MNSDRSAEWSFAETFPETRNLFSYLETGIVLTNFTLFTKFLLLHNLINIINEILRATSY